MMLNATKITGLFEWHKTMGYMLVKVTIITSKIRNISQKALKQGRKKRHHSTIKGRTLVLFMQTKPQ